MRGLLADRLQGRPTRTNFRTGHLTVCTLHPMRSVPHRVVCLLGLDDGAFPRKTPSDGDDLMLDRPQIGERNPRTEDLQLLLDAVMAATERLIVAYTSNDERTNLPRPPAVPVGELLDTIGATARCEDGDAHDQVVIHHPLQPFDPRNFVSGALVPDITWSFDRVGLEGAQALVAPRTRPGAFLARALDPLDDEVLELDDLVRFAERPVRTFLRRRLRISLTDFTEETEDGLRIELDGLQRWQVGERLLAARLAGVDGRTAALAEIKRGTLPPGMLGRPVIAEVYATVDAIVAEVESLLAPDAGTNPVDVRVRLRDGRLLSGTVSSVRGDTLLSTTYSRVSPRHRLASWVRLLAVTAACPERELSAVTVGRCDDDGTVTVAEIPPLGADADTRRRAALGHLAGLAHLYARGMREPLPLYCMTSAAYAQAAHSGEDPVGAGRKAWTSPWNYDKEDKEPDHQLVLGGVRTFDELIAEQPRARRARAGLGHVRAHAVRPLRAADVEGPARLRAGDAQVSRVSEPVAFSVTGPLPEAGITVLEASAGTGKTYTIAALAARYVAGGLPLDRLLLVTFTRMATGELRERVRSRLVSVERGLGRALAGAGANDGDPIVKLLAAGPEDEIALRRRRLQNALAEFDAATIATTHGFCQEVLGGLGIAADLAPDTEFVEDLSDLVSDVVDDLYVRRFRTGDSPPLTRSEAGEIARIAIANPAARIAPTEGEVPEMRVRLAERGSRARWRRASGDWR